MANKITLKTDVIAVSMNRTEYAKFVGEEVPEEKPLQGGLMVVEAVTKNISWLPRELFDARRQDTVVEEPVEEEVV